MGLKPLKHSLALTLAFAAIVPLLVVSVFALNHLAADNIEQIEKKNLLLARAMSGQVEVFLREPLVVMQIVSSMLKFNPDYSESEIQQVLDLHVKGSDLFESIYVLDNNGIVQHVGLPPGMEGFRRDINKREPLSIYTNLIQ